MTQPSEAVRLGHAIGHPDAANSEDHAVREALEITTGRSELLARQPVDSVAVVGAEKIFDYPNPSIYAYLGDLHPALGTVGLIIAPTWCDTRLQGVSRCDSGGLAGRRGGFDIVEEGHEGDVLKSLTPVSTEWQQEFDREVSECFLPDQVMNYVRGEVPDFDGKPKDPRKAFVDRAAAQGVVDRRLWTWEARFWGGPAPEEIEAVVFSVEAFKQAWRLRRTEGLELPLRIRLVTGTVSAEGVHPFDQDLVAEIMGGAVASKEQAE